VHSAESSNEEAGEDQSDTDLSTVTDLSDTRASIHKGTLRKKTDLKTDSFLLLFTDVLFGAFGRLPNFFTN
jgi:hypothetical protein